jgi:hypothetical protein
VSASRPHDIALQRSERAQTEKHSMSFTRRMCPTLHPPMSQIAAPTLAHLPREPRFGPGLRATPPGSAHWAADPTFPKPVGAIGPAKGASGIGPEDLRVEHPKRSACGSRHQVQ